MTPSIPSGCESAVLSCVVGLPTLEKYREREKKDAYIMIIRMVSVA